MEGRALTTLTVELPEELSANLERLSNEEHKDIQDIVRESIRRYVALEQFHTLCREIQPLAEAEGFLTDDDVFRAVS